MTARYDVVAGSQADGRSFRDVARGGNNSQAGADRAANAGGRAAVGRRDANGARDGRDVKQQERGPPIDRGGPAEALRGAPVDRNEREKVRVQHQAVDIKELCRISTEAAFQQMQNVLVSMMQQLVSVMGSNSDDDEEAKEPARKKAKGRKGASRGGKSALSESRKKRLQRADGSTDWGGVLQFMMEALKRFTPAGSHPYVDEPDISEDDEV